MEFEKCHPAVNLIYYTAVLVFALCFRQPVYLGISCLGALLFALRRNGKRSAILALALVPAGVLFACFYAGYRHFGSTILFRNFIGNPMTLESLLCGWNLAWAVFALCLWCSSLFSVCTTDKVVYLFGRLSPKFALLFSIALGMLPRLRGQIHRVRTARQGIGLGPGQGSFPRRIRGWFARASMAVTWSVDALLALSDTMASRGARLRGRSAYSIYRFDNRDRTLVVFLFGCLTLELMAYLLGQTKVVFDPRILLPPVTALSWVFYGAHLALCLLPTALELAGDWAFSRSRRAVFPEK